METDKRIIAFDLLRVIMVLLLIAFHAGVSFTETEIDGWYYQDEHKNLIFDGVLAFIHCFRHPIFFMISGFVTDKMYKRYGAREVLKKRIYRLFIPFLIVALLFVPLTLDIFKQLNPYSTSPVDINELDFTYQSFTGYVWFLYYLVLYNIIHNVIIAFKLNLRMNNISQWTKILFTSTIITLLLILSGKETMQGDYSLLPSAFSMFSYLLFYLYGIHLARNEAQFNDIRKSSVLYFSLGTLFFTSFLIVKSYELKYNTELLWLNAILNTMASIFYSLGGLGLAMKYYRKQLKIVRYISDSSYFVYLIHFPILMLLLLLTANTPYSAVTKFTFILIATLIISFLINYLWRMLWKNNPPV